MEAIASHAFVAEAARQRECLRERGLAPVKSRVETGDLRLVSRSFEHGWDGREIVRLMQRRQRGQLSQLRRHVFRHKDRPESDDFRTAQQGPAGCDDSAHGGVMIEPVFGKFAVLQGGAVMADDPQMGLDADAWLLRQNDSVEEHLTNFQQCSLFVLWQPSASAQWGSTMSLAFGFDIEADLIGALSVPRSFAPRRARGPSLASLNLLVSPARALSRRAAALFGDHARRASRGVTMRAAEREIRDEFERLADAVGLCEGEQTALCGGAPPLSRVILALETLGAALDLFCGAEAALAWFRAESPENVFNGRSALQAMGDDGRLGVELVLLHLRARMRGRDANQ